jgi:glucose/arabinose dehydrogenase
MLGGSRVLACISMRRTLCCLVVASALLAACGSDDNGTDASPTTTTDAPATSTTTEKPTKPTTTPPSTSAPAPASLDTDVKLTEVASGLDNPMTIAWRKDDDRMYVAEQGGTVRIVDGGTVGATVLEVDVTDGNEQGLLGLDFSADGSKLYVNYTDPDGDTHVVEYTMSGDTAGNPRELLFVDQPYANHNGGQVTMHDGLLYVGLGDGGSGGDPQNNAQNPDSLLGKMLRIDPNAGGDPEIWMSGLRNPWRYSFDRANGDIWIGDVGQNAYEEINWARGDEGGINWGWAAREGKHQYSDRAADNARDPIIETSHDDGNCAIVGGYVYRGKQIEGWNGVYTFSDNCNGTITGVIAENGQIQNQVDLDLEVNQLVSFAEDPNGEVYVLARGGSIFRFDPA